MRHCKVMKICIYVCNIYFWRCIKHVKIISLRFRLINYTTYRVGGRFDEYLLNFKHPMCAFASFATRKRRSRDQKARTLMKMHRALVDDKFSRVEENECNIAYYMQRS